MRPKSWIEVSLEVEGELAEAVAEVLARFAPDGVVIESTTVVSSPDDLEGRAVGPLRVYAYLPADHRWEERRRELEEALWYLGRIRPLPAAKYRPVEEADWAEAWKERFQPIPVGERLMIVPAWLEAPHSGHIAIRMDPGMAFGTGAHPTTQLCLELIETHLPPRLGSAEVIDVGCGSGILAIAALKLGAARALAVDIDPDAVAATRKNAALNQVSERLEVGLGSLSEIRAGMFSLRRAHLVLANILSSVIIQLLDAGLSELLHPGGHLILSGLLAEQEAEVLAAARAHNLVLSARRQSGDWLALALQHERPSG